MSVSRSRWTPFYIRPPSNRRRAEIYVIGALAGCRMALAFLAEPGQGSQHFYLPAGGPTHGARQMRDVVTMLERAQKHATAMERKRWMDRVRKRKSRK